MPAVGVRVRLRAGCTRFLDLALLSTGDPSGRPLGWWSVRGAGRGAVVTVAGHRELAGETRAVGKAIKEVEATGSKVEATGSRVNRKSSQTIR